MPCQYLVQAKESHREVDEPMYFAVFHCIFIGLMLTAVQPDCTDHFSLFQYSCFTRQCS